MPILSVHILSIKLFTNKLQFSPHFQYFNQFGSMKPFKYSQMHKKLNKQSEKAVEDQVGTDFLKLYEDIPADPRIDEFCQITTAQFDQKTTNNRYYSFELEVKEKKTEKAKYRVKQINQMLNFQLGFQPAVIPEKKAEINEDEILELEKKRKKLKVKFRQNIKVIITKLKKMKITVDDIFRYDIFEKTPYKFGKEIFDAIKQGNQEKTWRIMLMNKLAICSLDNTLKTPLVWSCVRGHHKIAETLINAGALINQRDMHGYDALFYSLKYQHPLCVKILVLAVCNIEEMHHKQSQDTDEESRRYFYLGLSLMKSFKKLDHKKRLELLDEQYKYLYSAKK